MFNRDHLIAPDLLRRSLTRALFFCLALGAITLALFARAAETPNAFAAPNTFPSSISFQSVATGLTQPVHVTNAGDARLFIVEQTGKIKILKSGSILGTPFLDLGSTGANKISTGSERGLPSVAFPPKYAGKGWFYVYYTDASGNLAIARYRVTGNADVADPNSEQMIINIPHPGQSNHNGGQLQFGRDGFLYLAPGDGGGGGDQFGTIGHGQDLTQLLGKILRLNVEPGYNPNPPPVISFTPAYTYYLPLLMSGPITPPLTYTIPITNPFTSTVGARGEVWAYGLRNPWRFSFDRTNGDLYIGDVGQNCYEEIDYTPAISSGMNFGWRITEGFHGFNPSNFNDCTLPDPNFITLTKPITAYDHSQGVAVIGGYVYRGSTYSLTNLYGTYLFSDEGSGRFWGAQFNGSAWVTTQFTDTTFSPSSFGEDQNGEMYFADYGGGAIYKIKTP